MQNNNYEIVVIGTSAGGMNALSFLFSKLKSDFPLPIAVVQHLHPNQNKFFVDYYNQHSKIPVIEALDKSPIEKNKIFIAPPDYHLLIENKETFSLSADEKVNYSRPSIDVLFESAAEVFGEKTISIILTGANNDGAAGSKIIKDAGGYCIAQNPNYSEHGFMPKTAIDIAKIDNILRLDEIPQRLLEII